MFIKKNFQISQEAQVTSGQQIQTQQGVFMKNIKQLFLLGALSIALAACSNVTGVPQVTDDFPQVDLSLAEQELDELAPQMLTCLGLVPNIIGTNGPNVLVGGPGNDVILGLGGDDIIDGRGGNDVICAGRGNDRVRGGPGKDIIVGQRGNDKLRGNGGRDRLYGNSGDDYLDGGTGNNFNNGGSHNQGDTCRNPNTGAANAVRCEL